MASKHGIAIASIAWALSCGGAPVFVCSSHDDCRIDERLGTCEPTGYCSFRDDRCDSGRRYGALAGDRWARQCVPVDVADGSTGVVDASSDGTGEASTVAPYPSASGVSEAESTGAPVDDTDVPEMPRQDLGAVEFATFGEREGATFGGVTRDTFIVDRDPALNFGKHGDIHLVHEGANAVVGLLAFDLRALPPGTTILAATLVLSTWEFPLADGYVLVFPMLEDWAEGEGAEGENGDGIPGASCWNERLPDVAWTSPGAGPGGSRGGEAVAGFDPVDEFEDYPIELPPALVQGWIDVPDQNFGLALVADANAKGYEDDFGDAWAFVLSSEGYYGQPLLELTFVR